MSEPWEEFPEIWPTKAKFWSWMRGGLRRGVWERHPVKIQYIQANRFKAPVGKKTKDNPEGLVWCGECEQCGGVFRQYKMEVDHLHSAGSLKGVDDLERFVTKLAIVTSEGLAFVCKPCHKIKSYAERMNISFEDARLEKRVIKFKKLKAKEQLAVVAGKTKKDREDAYRELLRGEDSE